MQLIINFLIFCVVLFLYIHVYNHIKTSSYLEVYEIENLSKDKFEDLNNFKLMNDQEINTFFAKVSYAVWIYSLRNIID